MAATNFGSSSIWLATAIQILPWDRPKLKTDKQISKPHGYQNSAAFSAKIVNPQYKFRTSKFEIIANHNGQLFSLTNSMNGEKHNFKTRDLVNFITIIQAHVWRAHAQKRLHNKWSTYICDEQREAFSIWCSNDLKELNVFNHVQCTPTQASIIHQKNFHNSHKKTHVNHQMCSKKLTQKENVFWENRSHKCSTVTSKYFNGFVYWAMTPTKIEHRSIEEWWFGSHYDYFYLQNSVDDTLTKEFSHFRQVISNPCCCLVVNNANCLYTVCTICCKFWCQNV